MKKSYWPLWILSGVLALTGCASSGKKELASKPPVGSLSAQQTTITEQANYLLFLPKDYSASSGKRYPVILFLHGIGESGSDVWLTAKHGPAKYLATHPDFPFIFVSPQCPAGRKWSDPMVLKVLDDVESHYALDTNRVYLTGLSMGGFGTWNLATMYPERFAAVAPMCGGGEDIGIIACRLQGRSRALNQLPFWVFHGAKDPVVPLAESERMVEALQKAGCRDVRLTTYPNGQHDIWTETYASPELYEWFLKHDRQSNGAPR